MFALARPPLSRYGGAVLVSAVALAGRLLLDPVLGDAHPFATFFLAVVISRPGDPAPVAPLPEHRTQAGRSGIPVR